MKMIRKKASVAIGFDVWAAAVNETFYISGQLEIDLKIAEIATAVADSVRKVDSSIAIA